MLSVGLSFDASLFWRSVLGSCQKTRRSARLKCCTWTQDLVRNEVLFGNSGPRPTCDVQLHEPAIRIEVLTDGNVAWARCFRTRVHQHVTYGRSLGFDYVWSAPLRRRVRHHAGCMGVGMSSRRAARHGGCHPSARQSVTLGR